MCFREISKRSTRGSQWQEITRETCKTFKICEKFLQSKHFQSIISIEIEIISLELDTNSNLLLLTDKGRFIYIEYTFLGFKGHLMETQSLPLPQKSSEPVFFRFTQRFDVNPADSEEQLHILESMVASDSTKSIKFIVVDEPFGDEKGECEEIGWAAELLTFHFFKNCLIDESFQLFFC